MKKPHNNILVVVSGGIAIYKAASVVRGLITKGKSVRVIMTSSATEFIKPLLFETLSNNLVGTDMFADIRVMDPIKHISFANWCDAVLVCPATANIIAKMANGIADDLASSTLLAVSAPIIICPAMNSGMWNNPATQMNISRLRKWNYSFIGPETGSLACNVSGEGRMSEPDTIINFFTNHEQ